MSQYIVVEIIPDPEEGGFTARVPDLPAYGEGETEEERKKRSPISKKRYRHILEPLGWKMTSQE
jgi:hypothetical protein